MTSVSVAIMAHPARRRFVDELLAGGLAGTPVVWDRINDRWDTGRRSMLAYDPSCTWHLVVQDDVVLCRDFLPGVRAALAAVPADRPVALYTGRVRPSAAYVARLVRTAASRGLAWLEFSGPWWGPAVAVPTHLIDDMVAWCDQQTIPNYDRRMTAYWDAQRVRCWYSYPSLVDHRVGGENPSLVPGRGNAPSRTAHSFIGDTSPLDIDWNTPPCRPGTRAAPGAQLPRARAGTRTWRHTADGRVRQCVLGSPADLRYADFDEWEEVP